jgi:protease II
MDTAVSYGAEGVGLYRSEFLFLERSPALPTEEDHYQAYRRIAGYSPYDNLAARAYPAIMATAGLTDPRVTYWEPAKWVARLRAMKTDDNLLLLKTNMDAGHAGAAGRFDKLKEVALVHAFALKVLGLLPKGDNNDP